MFRFFRRNREAVKKYLLIFFLSVVCIGMVITLAPLPSGDTSQVQTNNLAEIGGTPITTLDLQRSIQSRMRNFPPGFDTRIVPTLAKTIFEDMILRRALWIQAKKLGIEVSSQEMLQGLQDIPWLYPEGKFVGMDRYHDLIQQQTGMTVAQFEAQYREALLMEKMRALVTGGAQVAPAEVREGFLRRNAKARIEYVQFDPAQFLKAVEVTPAALEEAFRKDPERYRVPEERRARYVLIDADYVRAQVRSSEEELKQYYGQHLSEYRVPDRVNVAHVLLKTTGKTPAEASTVEKTAREVLARIGSGADFGELAKKYSEDASAANGGEIGWIVRGQTVKEFEDVAFSLKPGQVSELIKTIYGFHILKVLDKQTAHLQTFEEVKESIKAGLEKQKLDTAQQSLANDLVRQMQASPQGFEAVARKAGLGVKETPFFRYNQAVPDLGSSESFHNLAFQLKQGEIRTPISVPKGLAIIQLAEIIPEHLPKFEEVRARVEQDYRAAQSQVVAAEKAGEFATKCKTDDFRKLALAAGLTVKESADFTQQDYVESLGSGSQLAAAFALAPGKTSEVISLGSNRVVFRLMSHTPANEADFPRQQDLVAEELLERKRTLAWEIYRKDLKQQLLRTGELKLNDAAMNQFLASYQRP